MSRITNRATARSGGASLDDRLARVLAAPGLARVVPHLPAETLHRIIRHRGLEACGELVTAATPAQLAVVLDLDLWRPARPGHDAQFDVERFGEWLETLVDAGSSVAARTVAVLDADLVVAGLSRYVRVFDPGIFEPTAQSDDEAPVRHESMREGDSVGADQSMADTLECEVGGYLVRARRTEAWDAIVALLAALDAEHGPSFHAVMQGCRRLSNSRPEVDGLDHLLLAPEQHLHGVATERERRRSQQGYATPADARAFLAGARRPKHTRSARSVEGAIGTDPIVAAYFRAAKDAPDSPSPPPGGAAEAAESIAAVTDLLADAGMMPERPRALLEAADANPRAARHARLRQLMARLRDTDEATYVRCGRELAFLANTLLAGCTVQARPFTPQEASDAAAGICNLGLEHWSEASPIDQGLVPAFEAGWSVLHHDVGLFAAEQLIATLADVEGADHDLRLGLGALRRALIEQRDAGTPWRARDAAEILGMLDMTATVGVLGLLDECPVLPEAIGAVLDGRATSVDPTAFAFISTAAQIADVHRFLGRLPDVLSR